MKVIETRDDCGSAAEVMQRARRVVELRKKMRKPAAPAASPLSIAVPRAGPQTPVFVPQSELKPETPPSVVLRKFRVEKLDFLSFKNNGAAILEIIDEPFPSLREVLAATGQYFHIAIMHLRSHRRHHNIVQPRQIGMYICKKLTPYSFPQIGKAFDRDHTTVLHAVRKVEKLISDGDEATILAIAEIEAKLS